MRHFLIAAVAALAFGTPALAQSHGGYDGYGHQSYRGSYGNGYDQSRGYYGAGPGYAYRDRGYDYRGYNDRSYNYRGYNDRGYDYRPSHHDRRHERRDDFRRRDHHDRW